MTTPADQNPTLAAMIAQLGGPQIFLTVFSKVTWFESSETAVFVIADSLECRVRRVAITIDRATDTYTVATHDANARLFSENEGVYADGLADLVEEETRLFLTLAPRRRVA